MHVEERSGGRKEFSAAFLGVDDVHAAFTNGRLRVRYCVVDAATGVVSGLTVDGSDADGTYAETWRDRRVRVASRRTALVERGVAYAAQIVLEARITLAQVTPADTSVNLTSIRGDVEIPEDDAPNPMAVFDPL